MLPQFLTEILEFHKDKWGTQYFVELTIGINVAVFTIDRLDEYASMVRRWAKGRVWGAELNRLDQKQASEAESFSMRCFYCVSKCHGVVWWTCKVSAYLCAIFGMILLYIDAGADSYFIFLLSPTIGYFFLLFLGVLSITFVAWIKYISVADD